MTDSQRLLNSKEEAMKPKGIPDMRIGQMHEYRERSIRRRHVKGDNRLLNAAERSACEETRVSLCGTDPVIA